MAPRARKQSFFDPFHRLLRLQFGTNSGLFGQFLRAKDTQFERNHDQASPDSLVFDRTSAQMALTLTLVVAQ
jgi:hypothetical protein